MVFLAIIAALCGGIAKSQTIAKADLTQFYGKFSSKIPGNRDSIDVSHFVEWHIAPKTSDGFTAAEKELRRSTEGLWVFCYPGRQKNNNIFRSDNTDKTMPHMGTEVWFYLMSDAQGYSEGAVDVLIVWEETNHDSLRFLCAQIGPYGAGLTSLWVERAVKLPDESILLYVRSYGADGGKSWGSDMFLRATVLCDFRPFYTNSWVSTLRTKVHYDAADLDFGRYRVLELTDFRSPDSSQERVDYFAMRIDSADVRVIDLWRVAVDSFKIDTTATGSH
jgi:hypothetical protein